ncbi:hypothetical protein CO154_02010 [Candidatus Pacearchaeota archaeon CG_4_9_14_3_um_filter_31_7]|nr:MAG: hypothetical protein AUJ10_01470 [Candidatus Pacearchaeota archaeon CG1_02_31_27]PIN91994.1 MAG: hypothetical protein COU55_02945 [Candidatus Pacearchaeota archaeon CG10_big_fil_rev_8_21_14_0_10_31_59]PIZ81165.1 MAG: hypothetical protein COX99_00245 [Candidatus Pacearchaeota archaeon CG_4_10_14_0_2_um_filter_31_10]PJA70620.1 MAG: hypothetical protein CO154_02010 [Candidatus Pacearchaeota archaeon CG_4_9_14_3_um_filter_31_7]
MTDASNLLRNRVSIGREKVDEKKLFDLVGCDASLPFIIFALEILKDSESTIRWKDLRYETAVAMCGKERDNPKIRFWIGLYTDFDIPEEMVKLGLIKPADLSLDEGYRLTDVGSSYFVIK